MLTTPLRRLLATIAAVAVVAACGGDDDDRAADVGDTTAVTEAPDTTAATGTGTGEDVDTTAAPATDPPTTRAPTTTTTEAVASLAVTDLPDVLAEVVAAVEGGGAVPIELLAEVLGWPVPVPVPDATTLAGFDAGIGFGSDDETTTWSWGYQAAASGPVGDVDIAADDNGPGAVELRAFADAVLGPLGFEYSNSTGSDPGDPGGPHSINHVYVAADPVVEIGGVEGELGPVFMWLSENLSNDEASPVTGYRVEMDVDVPAADGVVPVPLVAVLAEPFPLPDAAVLTDADIRLLRRPADAFAAEFGTVYVRIALQWTVPAERLVEVLALYADGPFTEPGSWLAAEPDFFADGVLRPTEPSVTADRLVQAVLLARRYPGDVTVEAPTSDPSIATISLRVDLEPHRAELADPVE